MLFSKESLLDEEHDTILNEIIDHSRWTIQRRRVFTHDGKFYETYYSHGATEYQDESPYEYEGDMIECAEVFPVQKTITVYK